MATEIDELKAKIARIEQELNEAKLRLLSIEPAYSAGEIPPFAQLRGILKGKAHFTEQEIQDLKLKARDLD